MFRKLLLLPLMLTVLTLANCAGMKNLGDIVNVATTTIANPVDAVDIYRAKNVYAASLAVMDQYRIKCWSAPYATLMADPATKLVCQSRRPVVRAMQLAKAKARSALDSAQAFVRDNPTLNAATVITDMWSAVTAFQNAAPAQ